MEIKQQASNCVGDCLSTPSCLFEICIIQEKDMLIAKKFGQKEATKTYKKALIKWCSTKEPRPPMPKPPSWVGAELILEVEEFVSNAFPHVFVIKKEPAAKKARSNKIKASCAKKVAFKTVVDKDSTKPAATVAKKPRPKSITALKYEKEFESMPVAVDPFEEQRTVQDMASVSESSLFL